MYTQVLVVVLTCLAGAYGFFSPYFAGSQPALCGVSSEPCRLHVTMYHFNGTLAGEMETQTCRCGYPRTCSDDWSQSEHVISRNLISTTYNMTLNMMFCRPVQPQSYCNVGDEALVVSGFMELPQNVVSFNCRCPDHSPLLLHERRIGSDHRTYHTYVCDNHMPTCPLRVSRCMAIRQDVVDYTCKCPAGRHCKVSNTHLSDVTYGTCQA